MHHLMVDQPVFKSGEASWLVRNGVCPSTSKKGPKERTVLQEAVPPIKIHQGVDSGVPIGGNQRDALYSRSERKAERERANKRDLSTRRDPAANELSQHVMLGVPDAFLFAKARFKQRKTSGRPTWTLSPSV